MAWNENKEPRPEESKVMSHPGGESTSASSCCCCNMDAGQWWPSLEDDSRGAKQWRTGHPSRLSVGCDINTRRWLTLRLIHLLILLPGKIFEDWPLTALKSDGVSGCGGQRNSFTVLCNAAAFLEPVLSVYQECERLRAGQKGSKELVFVLRLHVRSWRNLVWEQTFAKDESPGETHVGVQQQQKLQRRGGRRWWRVCKRKNTPTSGKEWYLHSDDSTIFPGWRDENIQQPPAAQVEARRMDSQDDRAERRVYSGSDRILWRSLVE